MSSSSSGRRAGKSPWLVIPAIIVGAYALTGDTQGAAQFGGTVANTYGVVGGVGAGSLPDAVSGLASGLKASGGNGSAADPGTPVAAEDEGGR